MAYKTEAGMEETLPTRMTVDGVEFEINCYYNYMGEARVGIVPVGALDAEVIPASICNGIAHCARLVRDFPAKSAALYVAQFAVNFYARTISHVNQSGATSEQDALLTSFVALVLGEQKEALAVVPMVQKTSVPSVSEAIRTAHQNYVAAGAPRGSHLDYLGEDFDDL